MTDRTPKMQVYKAQDGWRWRLKATNGKIVASSGERFDKKSNATRAAESLLITAETAEIFVED